MSQKKVGDHPEKNFWVKKNVQNVMLKRYCVQTTAVLRIPQGQNNAGAVCDSGMGM